MKLYTEEQVRKGMSEAMYALDAKRIMKYIDEHVTPIELPSDEEIEEKSNFLFPIANRIGGSTYIAHKGFIEGAKWIREQILNPKK